MYVQARTFEGHRLMKAGHFSKNVRHKVSATQRNATQAELVAESNVANLVPSREFNGMKEAVDLE